MYESDQWRTRWKCLPRAPQEIALIKLLKPIGIKDSKSLTCCYMTGDSDHSTDESQILRAVRDDCLQAQCQAMIRIWTTLRNSLSIISGLLKLDFKQKRSAFWTHATTWCNSRCFQRRLHWLVKGKWLKEIDLATRSNVIPILLIRTSWWNLDVLTKFEISQKLDSLDGATLDQFLHTTKQTQEQTWFMVCCPYTVPYLEEFSSENSRTKGRKLLTCSRAVCLMSKLSAKRLKKR